MKNNFKLILCAMGTAMFATACGGGDNSDNNNNVPQNNQPMVIVENTIALCTDGLDNDNNGKPDCDDNNCQAFMFCAKAEEGQENTLGACKDGLDNDGDGDIDCNDAECKDFTICHEKVEENTEARCKDGLDNDGDGNIDCDDSECKAFLMCQSTPVDSNTGEKASENTVASCYDGEDNDGDGDVDCDDSGCRIFAFCANADSEAENTFAACQDGIDNDKDGQTDCDDDECKSFVVCSETADGGGRENTLEACTDGEDNDKDNNIDCLDPDCWGFAVCSELVGMNENSRELCGDGLDNDFDGKIDCEDDGCKELDFCMTGGQHGENFIVTCQDKIDNDGDGKIDCDDPECKLFDVCMGFSGTDECPDDPYKFKKDKCDCNETDVDGVCYINISSADEFVFTHDSNKNYIIKQPIDFGTTRRSPITGFAGKLEGNNMRITGLFNQTETDGFCGLFSIIDAKAELTNINLAITLNCLIPKADMKGNTFYIGGLAGRLNGKATNITGSSKVYVDNDGSPDEYELKGASYEYMGGLFGYADSQATLSDISIRGNLSTNRYSNYIGASSNYQRYYQYTGGVVGYASCDITNVHADMNVTAIRYDYWSGSHYLNTVVGGIAGYSRNTIDNGHFSGFIKFNARSTPTFVYLGGVAGQSGKIKGSSVIGSIETTGYTASKLETARMNNSYGTFVGGIVGKASGIQDGNNVDASLNISAGYAVIGGVVGYLSAPSSTDATKLINYVVNNTVNVDLALTDYKATKTYYGGLVGVMPTGVEIDSKIIYYPTNYLINNAVRTNYLFDRFAPIIPSDLTNDLRLNGVQGTNHSSSEYRTIVVNNYIVNNLVYTDEAVYAKYLPAFHAITGSYVYETYWEDNAFGDTVDALYLDASAKKYTYNALGIPITCDKNTVLGLLRYNAGFDGGVLSAHIPASGGDVVYSDWLEFTDKEGHKHPVPSVSADLK